MRIAVLSDTHGQLRAEVLQRMHGCDHILHGGDVGKVEILHRLEEVAPVTAVRGNVDFGDGLEKLPPKVEATLGGMPFAMIHRREDIDPAWLGPRRFIVFGHSHRPELEWRRGSLLLNPGAVGPRRFKLPLTMAFLTLRDDRLVPELVSVE